MFFSISFFALFSAALGAPAGLAFERSATLENTTSLGNSTGLGIEFDANSTGLPLLKLPYATYRASSYHVNGDYYHFSNIRFARAPVGDLRFAKPQSPLPETEIQDGSFGYSCYQAATESIKTKILQSGTTAGEDCLFLDMYVPGDAVRGMVKDLPILYWIYGGGFVFGMKDWFLYNTGMWVEHMNNSAIYISANHRVSFCPTSKTMNRSNNGGVQMGAFGFLNGPTVWKDATANAGLLDQRAALQWVQDYVRLVGGNKDEVTAWGLSSGSGSIMHHLIAEGGTLDPLYRRAIMNSPAFVPTYDPSSMETDFQAFAAKLNCSGSDAITCLRKTNVTLLQDASAETTLSAPTGKYGFGPAVDTTYIQDLPANEFRLGHYWKNISSIIVSHGSNEGVLFTNTSVTNAADFNWLIDTNFPNITSAAHEKLYEFYPEVKNKLEFSRVSSLIGKWAISCNTRWITQAYPGKVWGYKFGVSPGIHGLDLPFLWLRLGLDLSGNDLSSNLKAYDEIDIDWSSSIVRGFANTLQSFIASFALTGNPNTYKNSTSTPSIGDLPNVTLGDTLNLLELKWTGSTLVDDDDTPKEECDWWQTSAWTGVPESEQV
ncbi:MAG: hypothetical protein M1834_000466 [Cirrosporium novae-zelandiae]|nr:MAG: hypothetical protein M1834_000466 [Cirrosporium novae-zelandiae]